MIRKLNILALFVASCIIVVCAFDIQSSTKPQILSRRKRYVAFPEGSSFSAAWCLTIGLIGQQAPTSTPGLYVFGVNWGIAYELPNSTETANLYRYFNRRKHVEQRRNRRHLYEKIEDIMNKMGYNGRQCILKTLCETTQRLVPHGGNMIEEMFRILFTMPMTCVLPSEPIEHTIYNAAHRLGTMLNNCDSFACPISLVDLAQGYYNAQGPNVDTNFSVWTLFSNNFG